MALIEQQLLVFGKRVTALSATMRDGTSNLNVAMADVQAQTTEVARTLNTLATRCDVHAGRLDEIEANHVNHRGEKLSNANDHEHQLVSQWEQQLQAGLTALQDKFTFELERVERQLAQVVKLGEQTNLVLGGHQDLTYEKEKTLDTLQVRVEGLAAGLAVEARLREEAVSRISETLRSEKPQPSFPCPGHQSRVLRQQSSPPLHLAEHDAGAHASPWARARDPLRHQRSASPPATRNLVPVIVRPAQTPGILHSGSGCAQWTPEQALDRSHEGAGMSLPQSLVSPPMSPSVTLLQRPPLMMSPGQAPRGAPAAMHGNMVLPPRPGMCLSPQVPSAWI